MSLIEEAIAEIEVRLAEVGKEIEEGQDGWLDETGAYKDWESEAAEREIQGYYDGLQFALNALYPKEGSVNDASLRRLSCSLSVCTRESSWSVRLATFLTVSVCGPMVATRRTTARSRSTPSTFPSPSAMRSRTN